jgi:hypothetical protein
MMSAEPQYEVVSPVGQSNVEVKPISPRLPSLEGKKIGFEWNQFANGPILADALEDLLGRQFRGIHFTRLPPGNGVKWGEILHFDDHVGTIVKESGVDAAIVFIGG